MADAWRTTANKWYLPCMVFVGLLIQKSSNGLQGGSYSGIGSSGTGSYIGRALESLSIHVFVEKLCVGRITGNSVCVCKQRL